MEGSEGGGAVFDGPRLAFDENLAALIQRAQDVLGAQNRLRGLLGASRSIIGELELDNVLRRIVEAACDLVEADYGALGVIAADAAGLERFIHVGMDDETVGRIGNLPQGRGLLGLIIKQPRPLRLADLRQHPMAAGFPPHHPPMAGFIGVPIRVRGEVYGNLYLTRREHKEFTDEDEELVQALAATAGIAIENARLYDEARRRQEWLSASTDVTRELLTETDASTLAPIAERVHRLAGAELVTIAWPTETGDSLVVDVAVGSHAEAVRGQTYPLADTLSELVLATGESVAIVDPNDTSRYGGRRIYIAELTDVGPILVLPLRGASGVRGVLWVARAKTQRPFTAADIDMVRAFADQAALAWELADARRDRRRVDLLEDRARIARDLHDHVIQQLFAAGLNIQALASRAGPARAPLERVVLNLDEVIRQIRTSIFQLRPMGGGLRAAVLDVVSEVRPTLGFDPSVRFEGPVDTLVGEALVNDVTAVVREGLSNIGRHAGASSADVVVTARGAELHLTIGDNGEGIPASHRSSGLSNIGARAEAHGGTCTVGTTSAGVGTLIEWRVPLRRTAGDG